MSTKFNLERALQGDEVVDGFGDRVTDITVSNKVNSDHPLRGVSDGEWGIYSLEGRHFYSTEYTAGSNLYMKHASTDLPRKFTKLDTQIRFPEGQLTL